jgi:hypothetical protein
LVPFFSIDFFRAAGSFPSFPIPFFSAGGATATSASQSLRASVRITKKEAMRTRLPFFHPSLFSAGQPRMENRGRGRAFSFSFVISHTDRDTEAAAASIPDKT